jgi:hypothetical protein
MITTVKLQEAGYLVNGNIAVPMAEGNRDYQEVQGWLAEGNTPEPADIPPPPTYQELRATEYNLKSTGEQFGMQYDDAVNSTTTWIDWQQGIKTRIAKI